MSDRCYMELTCRKQDQARFEALGFTAQDWKQPDSTKSNPLLVVMVEEEADYAHSGDMPTDTPFHGFNGPGGSFGEGVFACDGRTYAEVETGHGGGYVVDWNQARQRPSARSLRSIQRYLRIRKNVGAMFEPQAKA